jgi:P4 family phage/plasmid primase-like protien
MDLEELLKKTKNRACNFEVKEERPYYDEPNKKESNNLENSKPPCEEIKFELLNYMTTIIGPCYGTFELDGQYHRLSEDKDSSKKDISIKGNIWVYEGKTYAFVGFKNWRNSKDVIFWSNYNHEKLDTITSTFLRTKEKENKFEEIIKKNNAHNNFKEKWLPIFEKAQKDKMHRYHLNKKIDPVGCRVDYKRSSLYIPIHGNFFDDNDIQGIECIWYEDKEIKKQSVSGSKKNGNFAKIGTISNDLKEIILCEGYSTGVSLYMALGIPVLCALSASNLPNVVKKIKKNLPDAKIYLCADDDIYLEKKGMDNKGLLYANRCIQQYDDIIILKPSFNNREENEFRNNKNELKGPTDFNDIHCLYGLDEIEKQFLKNKKEYKNIPTSKTSINNKDELIKQLLEQNEKLSNKIKKIYKQTTNTSNVPNITKNKKELICEANLILSNFLNENLKNIISNKNYVYCFNGKCYQLEENHTYLEKIIFDSALRKQAPHILEENIGIKTYNDLMRESFKNLIRRSAKPSTWFNQPPKYLALKNGVFDLKQKKLINFDNSLPIFHEVDYGYDPKAKCPIWLNYLNTSLENDEESILLLQQFAGNIFAPHFKFKGGLIVKGIEGSGKSIFLTTLKNLVGSANTSQVAMDKLDTKFEKINLKNKLLNISTENPSSFILGETFKKALMYEDISDQAKFKDTLTWRNTARFVFAMNEFPKFAEKNKSIEDRMIFMHFKKKIRGTDKEIKDLDEILKNELPGILNWTLEGLTSLEMNNKFIVPSRSIELQDEWRRENNNVYRFFQDIFLEKYNIIDSPLPNPLLEVYREEIYKHYNDWIINELGVSSSKTAVSAEIFWKRFWTIHPKLLESSITPAQIRGAPFRKKINGKYLRIMPYTQKKITD